MERVTRRKVLRWGAAGLLAGTGIGVVESGMVRTERTLRLPGWRADGFRVAQVSDVHLLNDGLLAAARQAVRWAVEAKPDVFVFTGDFLNHDLDTELARIGPAFEALEGIDCPCFAVLGNHDHWSGATEKIIRRLAKTRLRPLINAAADVQGVRVAGLDDPLAGRPDFSRAQDPSSLVLLHEPDYADRVRAGLVLSGHSHGGEICLPGGVPIYTPRGARRYRSGFYADAPTPVFVNRGTATLGPARVYCPPEVAVLTLRAT